MRTRLVPAAVLTAAAALLAGHATAAPTALAIDSVTVNGSTVAVAGTASFSPVGAQSVGGTNTNFANTGVADAVGINLTGGKIEPIAGGLRFIWETTGLPEQTPPEGVRYTWAFAIAGKQYQLQAKRTNLSSVTTAEDPVNHAKALAANAGFFQLRGACQTSYEGAPISGCYHLAFLKGAFDVAGKRVYMDLPYQTRDQIGRLVAPDFKPGAVLVENLTAGMSIAASFQAVATNTTLSDYTNGWSAYTVGEAVSVATGAEGDDPAGLEYAPATLTGSAFTGTASLVEGADSVFVRACQGSTCTYATRALGPIARRRRHVPPGACRRSRPW